MQKFGFLNHGLIKDVSPGCIHLQSVFSARTDHFKAQAACESRANFTGAGHGIFFIVVLNAIVNIWMGMLRFSNKTIEGVPRWLIR